MSADDTDAPAPSTLRDGAFEAYLRSVRRRPVIFAVVALATVVCAGAWLATRPLVHKATAAILVTPAPYDAPLYLGIPILRDEPSSPIRVFETAASMINSPTAAARTAQQLGHGWTEAQVQDAVEVEPFGASNIVTVRATAATTRDATQLADTFTSTSLQAVQQRYEEEANRVLAAQGPNPALPSDSLQALQLASLRAIKNGVNPVFFPLHDAQPATSRAGQSPARLLILALIPAIVFGVAAASLVEALATRRRRARLGDDELGAQ